MIFKKDARKFPYKFTIPSLLFIVGFSSEIGLPVYAIHSKHLPSVSQVLPWIDIATPLTHYTIASSRGQTWNLVMSDEFNSLDRDFKPGKDHLWTSIEKPDGVNGALGMYSHNMTYTECNHGTCYLNLKVIEEVNKVSVWNLYTRPPRKRNTTFYYRSAMLQSWNKFCFQGGLVEVRAQLPGAINPQSGNPDLKGGSNGRALHRKYYPTWPGIWMLGNLGRAIFSGSTNRMWPFSYDECNKKVFNVSNQRINACDGNPGHGLNKFQGRGAPEIDILEGGGDEISSSIQIGPGLTSDFRTIEPNMTVEGPGGYKWCSYTASCSTLGANLPNVPTATYKKREHGTWYRGLRYGYNPFCKYIDNELQTLATIKQSLKKGIRENTCNPEICPSSNDVQSSLGLINQKHSTLNSTAENIGGRHWSINDHGRCPAVMNAYLGVFLCDPDNEDPRCASPRAKNVSKINTMQSFSYQMDALSANWGIHMAAYLDFVIYQVEWVMGDSGYIRWMIADHVVYEIPAETITRNSPQDVKHSNPRRIMIEEPMYLIFNVAVSTNWAATPPHPGHRCKGNGKDVTANKICDAFPMHMKIDYVRVYQDLSSNMSVSCDPVSHPTRQFILDNIHEYEDEDNKHIVVHGGASCHRDIDCQVRSQSTIVLSGICNRNSNRCECLMTNYWGGPRCTSTVVSNKSLRSFGPSVFCVELFIIAFCIIVGFVRFKVIQRNDEMTLQEQVEVRREKKSKGKGYSCTMLSTRKRQVVGELCEDDSLSY